MTRHGRQLRLFLPDGTASGPRYYELVNWTGQALMMPVNRIKELVSNEWPEFQRPGIYLVRGQTEDGHARLYIGESENVAKRVQGHPSELPFEVTDLLLFSSKDDNLSKAHILWLETQLIQRAANVKRISLSNTKQPPLKCLSKAEEATMLEFISHLELLAQTAGYAYFAEQKKAMESAEEKLFFSMPKSGIEATAVRNDEGFTVLEGSQASPDTFPTLSQGYASQRDGLIEQGILAPAGDGKMMFTADCPFASPSAAAAIIAGSPTSGPERWKNAAGTKLKDLVKVGQPSAQDSHPSP